MISTASLHQDTNRQPGSPAGVLSQEDSILSLSKGAVRLCSGRGSTLAAALALAFLIFAVTAISMARVASIYAEATARRNQASALFLADAGIRKAAHSLVQDTSYTGEKATRLATGYFNVGVSREGGAYVATSTGYADSAFKRHPRKTVRASIAISGRSFHISDWRENP